MQNLTIVTNHKQAEFISCLYFFNFIFIYPTIGIQRILFFSFRKIANNNYISCSFKVPLMLFRIFYFGMLIICTINCSVYPELPCRPNESALYFARLARLRHRCNFFKKQIYAKQKNEMPIFILHCTYHCYKLLFTNIFKCFSCFLRFFAQAHNWKNQ